MANILVLERVANDLFQAVEKDVKSIHARLLDSADVEKELKDRVSEQHVLKALKIIHGDMYEGMKLVVLSFDPMKDKLKVIVGAAAQGPGTNHRLQQVWDDHEFGIQRSYMEQVVDATIKYIESFIPEFLAKRNSEDSGAQKRISPNQWAAPFQKATRFLLLALKESHTDGDTISGRGFRGWTDELSIIIENGKLGSNSREWYENWESFRRVEYPGRRGVEGGRSAPSAPQKDRSVLANEQGSRVEERSTQHLASASENQSRSDNRQQFIKQEGDSDRTQAGVTLPADVLMMIGWRQIMTTMFGSRWTQVSFQTQSSGLITPSLMALRHLQFQDPVFEARGPAIVE